MNLSKLLKPFIATTALTLALAGCGGEGASEGENEKDTASKKEEQVVNVYTARHYEADEQVYKDFTEETGIKVNVVKGEAEELIERLKREGESTEADLFITVDGGVLAHAKDNDILQPVESDVISENVPENMRDKENNWIGMATRARVIVYSKDRVSPDQLSTYEDLTSDKWKGKVLARSSTSLYNQSLLASFIELNGEKAAEEWSEGIVKNFARQPDGGDRDQAKAIAAGIGDVGIMNTYYVGLLANSSDPEEVKVAEGLGVFFPNQETNGTHVNISGIGLTKHSKNPENATKLIEYMTGKEAQEYLSANNYEFPVNPDAEKPEILKSWGDFKMQELDFDTLGKHNQKAIEIFNKTGWK
ncbi:iron deficiency-induced protein A [Cytobacillus firmus]|uniref:Fe(3+) ABC transporter substrate-binding protein n=1 Tax=Cytobacillus firmus TaxID=1399 RepID=UPI00077C5FD1|nr:Fe(3+) ABC transporter substrate-binding protein [Cytobacillus firmus]MBG9544433.1 iron deficiency-induced protein A [Cytobacillus firmus]MBG9552758.1 iron deficiency-induced protein A [Cytobacillus firmus]MBG9555362.1 iron deficiency-induced protein A [Cytobacillus firmus]MBG9573874.1 iron deficiency-induced protein A [Cytobacillus firmus]MEC1894657.1 Fe(3+) ABC transporter substrate-binding protein [Cytobacillus firmus]